MCPALLTLALVMAADDKAPAPDIEGKWLIVYAEEGGKRNTTWEQRVATAKGDTLSYSKDGDERSLRLSFGPDQTVKATAAAGKGGEDGKGVGAGPLSGVYIAGQDYLCLSLNPAKDGAADKGGGKGSSGALILILRRQR